MIKKCMVYGALALSFFGCQSAPTLQSSTIRVETIEFTDMPKIKADRLTYLGGFSGLIFEGTQDPDHWVFLTHTDRGPNWDAVPSPDGPRRPFLAPQFSPTWVRFTFNVHKRTVAIQEQIPLTNSQGRRLSGIPNYSSDEIPTDIKGTRLNYDLAGLDPEGIVKDEDGSLWMVEEYSPSILRFSAQGRELSRWVPQGRRVRGGKDILPKHLNQRVPNRGFEGVALDRNSVYAFLQSPAVGDFGTRILQVDKTTGQAIAEYAFPFERKPKATDRIGDAVAIGPGDFLVIDQNSAIGDKAVHQIMRVSLKGATNLLSLPDRPYSQQDLCTSESPPTNCITPVNKTLVADLAELGITRYDKLEGLALIDRQTIAIMSDNDFGIREDKPSDIPSTLLLLHLPQAL